MQTKLNHRNSDQEIKSQGVFSYAPGRDLDLDLHFRRESEAPLQIAADLAFGYPGRTLKLTESLEEQDNGNYHHELGLSWKKGKEFRLVRTGLIKYLVGTVLV